MKKLMIALAAAAMAAGVQASNVDWKFKFGASDVGKNLYAVDATALSGKDLAKLALADVTDNAFNWTDAAGETFALANPVISKSTYGIGTYASNSDSALTKSNASIYLILVDGDEYAIMNSTALDVSGSIYDPGQTGTKLSYTNQDARTYTKFAGDVPEPTSAMLLLLGVAGLALKRKQA